MCDEKAKFVVVSTTTNKMMRNMHKFLKPTRPLFGVFCRRYTAPLTDMKYLIKDVLNFPSHYQTLGFDSDICGGDMIDAIISESAKFAEIILSPLNDVSDSEGINAE